MGRPRKNEAKKTPTTFSMKSDPPWAAWLGRLAEHLEMSRADIVEDAVSAYARKRKFPEAAPKRIKE